MKSFAKIIAFVAIALISFSSFATNVEKGIYADDDDGVKQCLADLSAGTAVGYTPTLHNPIVSKKFEIKKVGPGGACLTQARVTGDDGKGMQVATVSVAEGFGVGVLKKDGKVIESRMETCSNLYENILFPKAKVAEKQPEATQVSAPATQVVVVQEVKVEQQTTTPATTPSSVEECKDCTPLRKTEEGKGGWCRVDSGRTKLECNFEWKVLQTQDQVRNCGCQVFVPSTKQTVGFLDAQPGSARCLQQKKLWAKALGITYNDSRPPQ